MHTSDSTVSEEGDEGARIITLLPREDREVCIGVFEEAIPPPEFTLEFGPRTSEKIKYELMRFDEGDEYRLIYYFQNLAYHNCQVTIREKQDVGDAYVS